MSKKIIDVLPAQLAQCKVFDQHNKSIVLSSLWDQSPAILIFLRHFGCIACRAHAKDVWNNKEKYEQTGAKIYFIGNGAPPMIQAFVEDLKIEGATIFTDPSLKSFHSAGFKRGFFKALGPKSIINGINLSKQGHKQGVYTKDQGDLWQLGGILAVKPGGKVTYQYISEATGDFPPEEDLKLISQH